MSVADQLTSMLRHLESANRQVLETLISQPELAVRSDALRLYGHVFGAERVWLTRMAGSGEPVVPWPSHSLNDLESVLTRNVNDLSEILSGLGEDDLEREIEYRTTSGDLHRSRLVDILTHVMLHGAYHRGQVAWVLRQAGGEPVATDFIMMARMARVGRVALGVVLLAASACQGSRPRAVAPVPAAECHVEISNLMFVPISVTVSGTAVRNFGTVPAGGSVRFEEDCAAGTVRVVAHVQERPPTDGLPRGAPVDGAEQFESGTEMREARLRAGELAQVVFRIRRVGRF